MLTALTNSVKSELKDNPMLVKSKVLTNIESLLSTSPWFFSAIVALEAGLNILTNKFCSAMFINMLNSLFWFEGNMPDTLNFKFVSIAKS